jgi:hypothetical protein
MKLGQCQYNLKYATIYTPKVTWTHYQAYGGAVYIYILLPLGT